MSFRIIPNGKNWFGGLKKLQNLRSAFVVAKPEMIENPDLTSYFRVFSDVSRFRFGFVDAIGTALGHSFSSTKPIRAGRAGFGFGNCA